jgi:hypothetical protein
MDELGHWLGGERSDVVMVWELFILGIYRRRGIDRYALYSHGWILDRYQYDRKTIFLIINLATYKQTYLK